MFSSIIKRDGRIEAFNESKITEAIFRCLQAVGESDRQLALELTLEVIKKLRQQYEEGCFSVENVQDIVETVLIGSGHTKVAKAYILYRENRSRLREARSELMDAVNEILRETNRENANVGNSPSLRCFKYRKSLPRTIT